MQRAGLAAAAALAIIVGSAAAPARAQNCDVFTDVSSTDSFCPAVQWLKNRGITSGCTTTTYCPTSDVTRAAMALFMNRMGIALTPRLVGRQSGIVAFSLTPGQFQAVCFGAPLPAVNYPQTARASGTVTIAATGPQLALFLMMTLDGEPYSNMNTVSNTVANPNGTVHLSWSSNTVAVPAGKTVGFAVGISNPAGAGTLQLGTGVCALEADVVNANPATPPFDE